MLRQRRLTPVRAAREASEDGSELTRRRSRFLAGSCRERPDPIPHPPRPQKREGEDRQRGGERAVAVDVREMPAQSLLALDLREQNTPPGDSEAFRAPEDLRGRRAFGGHLGRRGRRIAVAPRKDGETCARAHDFAPAPPSAACSVRVSRTASSLGAQVVCDNSHSTQISYCHFAEAGGGASPGSDESASEL